MPLKLKDLAVAVLQMDTLESSATTISVDDASVFPILADGTDYFHATLAYSEHAENLPEGTDTTQSEIVRVTGVVGNNLTVQRGVVTGFPARIWHTGGGSGSNVILTHSITSDDATILTGSIDREYRGAEGGKIGTTDNPVPETHTTAASTQTLTVGDIPLQHEAGEAPAGAIIIPRVGAEASAENRTIQLGGHPFNVVPLSGGVRHEHVGSDAYPVIGGSRGDLIAVVGLGTETVLASPFAALLTPGDSDSIFGGSAEARTLGSLTIAGDITVASSAAITFATFSTPGAIASQSAMRDHIAALGKTFSGGYAIAFFFGGNVVFNRLSVYDDMARRGEYVPRDVVRDAAPTATDDSTKNFARGDKWTMDGTSDVWTCTDNTAGAAVWEKISNKKVEKIFSHDGSGVTNGTYSLDDGKQFSDYDLIIAHLTNYVTTQNAAKQTVTIPIEEWVSGATFGEAVDSGGSRVWAAISYATNTTFNVLGDLPRVQFIYGVKL